MAARSPLCWPGGHRPGRRVQRRRRGRVARDPRRDAAFGHERDRENCPVPTVIPSMGLVLTPQQLAACHACAMVSPWRMPAAQWLGGAQGFHVKWHGVLLIDDDGDYHFEAGAPAEGARAEQHDGTPPVLAGHTAARPEDLGPAAAPLARRAGPRNRGPLPLRRGAYEIDGRVRPARAGLSARADLNPQRTGFEIKYRGPDTHERLVAMSRDAPLPHAYRARR